MYKKGFSVKYQTMVYMSQDLTFHPTMKDHITIQTLN